MNSSSLSDNKKSENIPCNYQNLVPHQDNSLIRINQLASITCGVTMSSIGFEDSENQWFKGGFGFDFRDDLLSDFFRNYAQNSSGFFEISDISKITLPSEITSFFSNKKIHAVVKQKSPEQIRDFMRNGRDSNPRPPA